MTTHVAQLDGSAGRDAARKRAGRRWWMLLVWCLAGLTLLLVVPIVGLLGSVMVANFVGGGTAAREAATYQSMAIVHTALKQYQLDRGNYPPTLANLTPRFLGTAPVDAWQRPFVYAPTPGGTNPFTLSSTGASGKDVFDYWKERDLRK